MVIVNVTAEPSSTDVELAIIQLSAVGVVAAADVVLVPAADTEAAAAVAAVAEAVSSAVPSVSAAAAT